ncbi:MAG: helix-turn-helix domain-containing protein [Candidatus Hodarchaeota archaeon]
MIENVKKRIDSLLKEAKFETFFFKGAASKSIYCFDSLVKKDDSVFLIKIFPNIDNLNANIVKAIKKLSLLLNSKPILIGMKNRYQNLDDNTIYIREGLPFITLNTLENILRRNIYPYILARRGGGVIFLDGNLMKTIREQKNVSRKEISNEIGVTKRTVCSYENESMRPSLKIGEKILKILENKSIFRKINLFKWQIKLQSDEEKSDETRELSEFESGLQDIFEHIGISTIWYKKGQVPFELSLFSKTYTLGIDQGDNFYPLFSGVSQEDENDKITKININNLTKFANLFHKNALFIVSDDFKIPDFFKKSHIPIIKLKSLESLDNEEEFVEIFKDN